MTPTPDTITPLAEQLAQFKAGFMQRAAPAACPIESDHCERAEPGEVLAVVERLRLP